jgi:hypothetical protein
VELIVLGVDFFGAHGRRGWIQPWPGRPCLVGGRMKGPRGAECKKIEPTAGIF